MSSPRYPRSVPPINSNEGIKWHKNVHFGLQGRNHNWLKLLLQFNCCNFQPLCIRSAVWRQTENILCFFARLIISLLLFLSHFPGSDWSHRRVRLQDVTVPRHTVLWKPRGLVRISIYYSWFTRELIDMDLITVKILSLSSLLSDLSVWSSRLKWQNIVDLFSETRCWLTLWTNTL